jgi:hypothetical protein
MNITPVMAFKDWESANSPPDGPALNGFGCVPGTTVVQTPGRLRFETKVRYTVLTVAVLVARLTQPETTRFDAPYARIIGDSTPCKKFVPTGVTCP